MRESEVNRQNIGWIGWQVDGQSPAISVDQVDQKVPHAVKIGITGFGCSVSSLKSVRVCNNYSIAQLFCVVSSSLPTCLFCACTTSSWQHAPGPGRHQPRRVSRSARQSCIAWPAGGTPLDCEFASPLQSRQESSIPCPFPRSQTPQSTVMNHIFSSATEVS